MLYSVKVKLYEPKFDQKPKYLQQAIKTVTLFPPADGAQKPAQYLQELLPRIYDCVSYTVNCTGLNGSAIMSLLDKRCQHQMRSKIRKNIVEFALEEQQIERCLVWFIYCSCSMNEICHVRQCGEYKPLQRM